jgi:hypothetical protein
VSDLSLLNLSNFLVVFMIFPKQRSNPIAGVCDNSNNSNSAISTQYPSPFINVFFLFLYMVRYCPNVSKRLQEENEQLLRENMQLRQNNHQQQLEIDRLNQLHEENQEIKQYAQTATLSSKTSSDYQKTELEQKIRKLQGDITKLQQENYDLQANRSTNMASKFPPKEILINRFNHFGQQILVSFISTFECYGLPELLTFLMDVVDTVQKGIETQYQSIFNRLFPGSLSPLRNSNAPIMRELINHLQNNYIQIIELDSESTINGLWETLSLHNKIPSFPSLQTQFKPIAHEMYDLFWQIKLSNWEFGSSKKYDPKEHHNPFNEEAPSIVIQHLLQQNEFVIKGFVY